VLPCVLVAPAVVDSHLHVWDETAAGLDPGPMRIGYSAQATASVELFMDYMDEAGVARAVFVQPWFCGVRTSRTSWPGAGTSGAGTCCPERGRSCPRKNSTS
jgi:hypothetical protein